MEVEPLTPDQVKFRVKRLDWLHWLMLLVIAVLAFFLWVSPYRYEKMGQRIVRIKRFSGEAEILRVDGWKTMKPRVPEGFRELGQDEKILPLEPPAPGGTVDR